MLRNVLSIAACSFWHLAMCHVPEDTQPADPQSRQTWLNDRIERFCSDIGTDQDMCDAHPHKCQWNWHGENHGKNGCAKTECASKDELSCEGADRCTWKAGGRWKGLCIADACSWSSHSPEKCDARPSQQCRFDHALSACSPHPQHKSKHRSPERKPSNMWSSSWTPWDKEKGLMRAEEDAVAEVGIASPQCSLNPAREQCDAVPNNCMWSQKHGCVASGCGYWKLPAECMGPCTWKSEGIWKGICVTNNCMRYHEEPAKCNSVPENQCRYSLSFQRCVANHFEYLRSPFLEPPMVVKAAYSAQVYQHNASQGAYPRIDSPLQHLQPAKHSSTVSTARLILGIGVVSGIFALILHTSLKLRDPCEPL